MFVDEVTLTQYALGTLEPEKCNAVQKELAASSVLQKELVSIQTTFQYVAHLEKPLNPGDKLRNLVLKSIEDQTRFAGFLQRFSDFFELDINTSRTLLGKIDQPKDQAWQSTLFPGVNIMKFPSGLSFASATCGIVKVQAGKLFPAHQHQGSEKTLILQGTAIDDHANILSAGDTFCLPAGSHHSFRVLGDETFIFAVVLRKENKWLWLKTLRDYWRIHRET